jgi:hypothetical protein
MRIVMKLSKAKLKQQVGLMLKNGYDPKAQEILAKAGGGPASLEHGQALYDQWQTNEERISIMDARKQAARQAEETAYRVATAEIGDLIETLYHYFNDDPAILAQLGLRRRHYNGPKKKAVQSPATTTTAPVDTDGQTQDAADPTPAETSTSSSDQAQPTPVRANRSDHQTRAELARSWQLLCTNVQQLEQPALDLIANQEWTLTRCAEAAALVQAMIQADQTQQAAISAYHSQVDQAREDRLTLYGWYWPIAKLAKRAIRKLPAEKRVQYETLLGF